MAGNKLFVAHSTNGGVSFAPPVNVLDKPKAYIPQLCLEPDSNAIDVLTYTGASDPDPTGSYRFMRSTNGGTSFGPSMEIMAPVNFKSSRDDDDWLGDYVGAVSRDGYMFTTFTNNPGGVSHIFFSRFKLPTSR